MEYAQLNEALTEAIQITTHGNVEWDANHYCSAAALIRDGKADQFRVVQLTVTEAPTIDPMTQAVMRDGCEQVEGEWRYKWRVDALTAEQIAAKIEADKTAIRAQIAALEASQLMPRATREFMLLFMETSFTAEQLADNFGYVAVKTFDDQIKALRDQLV